MKAQYDLMVKIPKNNVNYVESPVPDEILEFEQQYQNQYTNQSQRHSAGIKDKLNQG